VIRRWSGLVIPRAAGSTLQNSAPRARKSCSKASSWSRDTRSPVADYLAAPGTNLNPSNQITTHACGKRHPKSPVDAENRRTDVCLFEGEIVPAPESCLKGKHPGCGVYEAWVKAVTSELSPAPGPQSGADHAATQQRIDELKAKHPVTIVPRAKWGARPPKADPKWVDYPAGEPLPMTNIVIHHTSRVNLVNGGLHLTPRDLQDFEMDKNGFSDIPHQFMITADGTIYEGREMKSVGAHAGEIAGNTDGALRRLAPRRQSGDPGGGRALQRNDHAELERCYGPQWREYAVIDQLPPDRRQQWERYRLEVLAGTRLEIAEQRPSKDGRPDVVYLVPRYLRPDGGVDEDHALWTRMMRTDGQWVIDGEVNDLFE
jgi:hypothetical protein